MIGTGIGILKRAQFAPQQMRDYVSRVLADGGTIEDMNALRSWYREALSNGSYSAASLSLFPSGKKAGKLYSELPTSGEGDFTVTRASNTAVRKNAQGYYEPVLANFPRYDYDIATGKWSVNVEPAATNLITYPRLFSNAYWTKTGATIEGDPTTAGAEKVINGGFDTDITNWNAGNGTLAWNTSGYASLTGNGVGTPYIQQSITLSTLFFKISFKVKSATYTGPLRLSRDSGSTYFINPTINVTSSWQTLTYYGYGVSGVTSFLIRTTAISGDVIDFDDISIKEVQGFACPFVNSSGVNTLEGMKLVADSSSSAHRIFIAFPPAASGVYSFSLLCKKAEYSKIGIHNNVTGGGQYFTYNINTLAKIDGTETSYSVQSLQDGWILLDVRMNAGTSTFNPYIYVLNDAYTTGNPGLYNYTGDGTSGIYICHAQLETGSADTSPIYAAIEGSSETRNADAIQVALPIGVTKVTLTDYLGVDTVDNTPSDPYVIPVGRWHQIIME